MSLEQTFRLHYGESRGKKVEEDFNLFRLGYKAGLCRASEIASKKTHEYFKDSHAEYNKGYEDCSEEMCEAITKEIEGLDEA